jgi:hypothetical protein
VNLAFDLFFKSFDVGMAVSGICHSRGHLCFTNTSWFFVFFFSFQRGVEAVNGKIDFTIFQVIDQKKMMSKII